MTIDEHVTLNGKLSNECNDSTVTVSYVEVSNRYDFQTILRSVFVLMYGNGLKYTGKWQAIGSTSILIMSWQNPFKMVMVHMNVTWE